MRNFIVALLLMLTLNGCVSSAARDATRSAIDEADKQVRLRWAEEWKPALKEEAKKLAEEAKKLAVAEAKRLAENLAQDAKEKAVESAVIQLDKYKKENEGRLERIGVRVEQFDANKDGKVSGAESLALLREIKAKNDKSPNPLEWWEILLAVGAAYVPLTGAKELARKKLNGTGDGSAQPA